MTSLISWLNGVTFITRNVLVFILPSSVFLEQMNAACGCAVAFILNTVEPGYNDIGLYDTPSITSDTL